MSSDPYSGPGAPFGSTDAASFPALSFDPDAYAGFLDDGEMTEAQQREFLEALWSILVAFVDLGFRIHPVQQAIEGVNTSAAVVEPDSTTMLACKQGFNSSTKGKAAKQAKAHAEERNDA